VQRIRTHAAECTPRRSHGGPHGNSREFFADPREPCHMAARAEVVEGVLHELLTPLDLDELRRRLAKKGGRRLAEEG
jgi:hypothetical protein